MILVTVRNISRMRSIRVDVADHYWVCPIAESRWPFLPGQNGANSSKKEQRVKLLRWKRLSPLFHRIQGTGTHSHRVMWDPS